MKYKFIISTTIILLTFFTSLMFNSCKSSKLQSQNLMTSKLHYKLGKNDLVSFDLYANDNLDMYIQKDTIRPCPVPPGFNQQNDFRSTLTSLSKQVQFTVTKKGMNSLVLEVKNKSTNDIIFTQEYLQDERGFYILKSENQIKTSGVTNPSVQKTKDIISTALGKCDILGYKMLQ